MGWGHTYTSLFSLLCVHISQRVAETRQDLVSVCECVSRCILVPGPARDANCLPVRIHVLPAHQSTYTEVFTHAFTCLLPGICRGACSCLVGSGVLRLAVAAHNIVARVSDPQHKRPHVANALPQRHAHDIASICTCVTCRATATLKGVTAR